MITQKALEDAIFKTIKKSSTIISPDVYSAFKTAIKTEKSEASKRAFEATLRSLDLSKSNENPACPDTGWPLFFCKIGNDAKIEGGILALEEISRRMVEKATKEGSLRATMKHPLTGVDPGNNIGNYDGKDARGDAEKGRSEANHCRVNSKVFPQATTNASYFLICVRTMQTLHIHSLTMITFPEAELFHGQFSTGQGDLRR
jgi:hypothetical protein